MLTLPATLTMAEANAALEALIAGIEAETGAAVTIDASALTQLDTSAVAALIECRRLAMAKGLRFELRGVPQRLADLASLYGVHDLVGIEPTAVASSVT